MELHSYLCLIAQQHYRVAFLGDSITEALTGATNLERWTEELGPLGVFGVPGDRVSHLMWRLGHGGLPQADLFVINIGTNDLFDDWADPLALAGRVRDVALHVRAARPSAHVLLLSLFWRDSQMDDVQKVNAALAAFVHGAGDARLHWSDLPQQLPPRLFSDGLHTEEEAWERVIDGVVAPLVREHPG